MHITASVFVNVNESGLHADYECWVEEHVPFNAGTDPASGGYLHNRTGEGNADAHHKRQIMGRKSSSRLPTESCTSAHGSIFSITSLMEEGGNGCW